MYEVNGELTKKHDHEKLLCQLRVQVLTAKSTFSEQYYSSSLVLFALIDSYAKTCPTRSVQWNTCTQRYL